MKGYAAMTLLALALALGAALALAAACGASDQGTEPSPASPVAGAATTSPTQQASAATASAATPAAALPQLPVTVTDKDGRQVTVTDVSRIVPLNGEIAEIVWALGLGDRVVGVDTSATYPPQAQQLPNIGYQRTLSAEGVLALRPTLIIGNENAGPPPVIEQLRGAGVGVVMLPYSPAVESAPAKIRAVGEALGVADAAATLASTTQAEIDTARALAAKATSRPKVAYLNVRGGGTQQIWGAGTAGAAMIEAAGGTDAGSAAGIRGSRPITAESLAAIGPEIILVLSASLESIGGVDGLLQVPGVAQTHAGRNRRVIEFEDQYRLGLGPRTGQALMELVKAIHPELR
jgi:iron complex transport system substrate-binding protein